MWSTPVCTGALLLWQKCPRFSKYGINLSIKNFPKEDVISCNIFIVHVDIRHRYRYVHFSSCLQKGSGVLVVWQGAESNSCRHFDIKNKPITQALLAKKKKEKTFGVYFWWREGRPCPIKSVLWNEESHKPWLLIALICDTKKIALCCIPCRHFVQIPLFCKKLFWFHRGHLLLYAHVLSRQVLCSKERARSNFSPSATSERVPAELQEANKWDTGWSSFNRARCKKDQTAKILMKKQPETQHLFGLQKQFRDSN